MIGLACYKALNREVWQNTFYYKLPDDEKILLRKESKLYEHEITLMPDYRIAREKEFKGAFSKICFAVKSHRDPEKSENYLIFREILDGFKIN